MALLLLLNGISSNSKLQKPAYWRADRGWALFQLGQGAYPPRSQAPCTPRGLAALMLQREAAHVSKHGKQLLAADHSAAAADLPGLVAAALDPLKTATP